MEYLKNSGTCLLYGALRNRPCGIPRDTGSTGSVQFFRSLAYQSEASAAAAVPTTRYSGLGLRMVSALAAQALAWSRVQPDLEHNEDDDSKRRRSTVPSEGMTHELSPHHFHRLCLYYTNPEPPAPPQREPVRFPVLDGASTCRVRNAVNVGPDGRVCGGPRCSRRRSRTVLYRPGLAPATH